MNEGSQVYNSQTNHATMRMGRLYGYEGDPNIVLIGVEDSAALKRASELLGQHQIAHHFWREPDHAKLGFDDEFTAIATAAIRGSVRLALSHFKLWRPVVTPAPLFASSSVAEQPILNRKVEGSMPS